MPNESDILMEKSGKYTVRTDQIKPRWLCLPRASPSKVQNQGLMDFTKIASQITKQTNIKTNISFGRKGD